MRLVFFLAAVLITVFEAIELNEIYDLPDGFPDGTLITIFFHHFSDRFDFLGFHGEEDFIRFYFYDWKPREINGKMHYPTNIPAFLRIERGWAETVYSDTKIDGKWQKEVVEKQSIDVYPTTRGWWRIDVMKVDKYRMNVFFQGFWAGVRTFDLPLDNIISFQINSKDIPDKNFIEITYRYPNSNLVLPTYHQFMEIIHSGYDRVPRAISTLPGFPNDGKIELSVVMNSLGGKRSPLFVFVPVDGSPYSLKMRQEWSDGTHKLSLDTNDQFSNGGHSKTSQCTFDWSKPNGDLVHLTLERFRYNVVEVRVLYKNMIVNMWRDNKHATCWMWIPDELVESFDRPFNIQASQGAIFLHINRSYPDKFPPSENHGYKFAVTRYHECSNRNSVCYCCDHVSWGERHNCVDGKC